MLALKLYYLTVAKLGKPIFQAKVSALYYVEMATTTYNPL